MSKTPQEKNLSTFPPLTLEVPGLWEPSGAMGVSGTLLYETNHLSHNHKLKMKVGFNPIEHL